MKAQTKKAILEILQEQRDMIGSDKEHFNTLISELMLVYCPEVDDKIEESINDYFNKLVDWVGYDTNNNGKRRMDFVAQRDAICYMIDLHFGDYFRLPYVLADLFGKDRTSMIAAVNRSKVRFEINDELLMHYISKVPFGYEEAA